MLESLGPLGHPVDQSGGAPSRWCGTTHAPSASEVEQKASNLMAHLCAVGSSSDRRFEMRITGMRFNPSFFAAAQIPTPATILPW